MNHKNKIVVISTILFLILALFFLINKLSNKGTYSASTLPSISLSCTPNKVSALGETDCNIVLNTAGKKILGVNANYIKNNQLNYVSYNDVDSCSTNCFETIASTDNGFVISSLTGASGSNIVIGSIHIKMTNQATSGNSYSVGLSDIELCDDEYNLIQISGNVTTSVLVKSNDATLKSLTVSAGTLSPAFASGTTTYTVYVPYSTSKITITGVANASTAMVTGTGTKNLTAGENTLSVVVTAEDGTTKKTYTINVTVDTKYVVIKYHTNGGALAEEHDSRISLSNNYVMLNNEYLVTSIAYGNSLGTTGLINYNNSTYLNIEKSGYAAKSNAEWNTEPNGTGTSYSQGRAYLSDDFCDASNGICEVTLYVNWVPNNIEAVLDIDNSIIKSITAGTTFANIMSNVQTTETIVLYDKSGNIKQNSETLKTGDYITVTSNGTSASYYLSVLGDVNGDGNVTVVDVAKLFQHYRRTNIIPDNERYYIIAGDTVMDDVIKLTDVAKLFQYVRGTIPNLE